MGKRKYHNPDYEQDPERGRRKRKRDKDKPIGRHEEVKRERRQEKQKWSRI
uniref:Uncharacterized protein n=1 Tax=viral metagenome TaxID=1070528 RepID=A0A6M3IWR5_9ZZZZ